MKLKGKIELKLENSTDANLKIVDDDQNENNDVGGKLVFKEGTFPEDWEDGDEVSVTVSDHSKHDKKKKDKEKEEKDSKEEEKSAPESPEEHDKNLGIGPAETMGLVQEPEIQVEENKEKKEEAKHKKDKGYISREVDKIIHNVQKS